MKKKLYFLLAVALIVITTLTGCEDLKSKDSEEGIEQEILEFPVEMVKDDSIFILEEPKFYYYDSPGVCYGFCVLQIDTSGAKEEEVELLNSSSLDDGDGICVSVSILQNDEVKGSGDSMELFYSTCTDTKSTFVFYTGASKDPYQNMSRNSLYVYVKQNETYREDKSSEEKNKINKYERFWRTEEIGKRTHVAESYEAMEDNLWQAIEPKLNFKSVGQRIADFESSIKKKIHDTVKAESIRRKTTNAVSIIKQLAEENARNPGIDDGACAYEILKKHRSIYLNLNDRPATGEELEMLLYSGIFLKNRFRESSSFYKLGDLIESAVVSVYIGVDDTVKTNHELIKEEEESCEIMRKYFSGARFH